jgi:hypothetical protein
MKKRRSTIYAFLAGLVLAGLLLTNPPAALADTVTIGFCNGCGVSGPYGTVTLTQSGSNVNVVITASSGFSWKTGDGSDIEFNPTVALTASSIQDANGTGSAVSSNGPSMNGLTFGFQTNQTVDGLGTFAVDLQHVGQSQVGNVASVASWDFTILGVTVAQLEGTNTDGVSWGVHTCDASGTNCSTNTFYGGSIPDGGMTVMLLGGVLVGLETLRRRFRV